MLAQTKETKVILLGPQNTDVKLFILVLMGFLLSLLSVKRNTWSRPTILRPQE